MNNNNNNSGNNSGNIGVPINPNPESDQSISIRVMGLSRPSFDVYYNHPTEENDVLHDSNGNYGDESFTQVVSEALTIPRTFGNIYLGEQFSCYVCFHNHSYHDVTNVVVKCELQTQSNAKFALIETPTIAKIAFGETQDYVIKHEIKELGTHVLTCSVQYVKMDGERKFFKKLFKFVSLNPLSVKTKTVNILDDVYLEAHIQNGTAHALVLETVKFEPTLLYMVKSFAADLNSVGGLYLKPNDVHQYVWCIHPKADLTHALQTQPPQNVNAVGKIDITWRTCMGETGRLQTSLLQRKQLPNSTDDVGFKVTELPSHILLEKPFAAKCSIANRMDKAVKLRLLTSKEKMHGILINGVSGGDVAEVPPHSSVSMTLNLFPISQGLHKLSGLVVHNLSTDKRFDFDNCIDIFVEQ